MKKLLSHLELRALLLFIGAAVAWAGVAGSGLFWWQALNHTNTAATNAKTPHFEMAEKPEPLPETGHRAFDEVAFTHLLSGAASSRISVQSMAHNFRLIGLMTWDKRSAALISVNGHAAQHFLLGQEVHAGLVLQRVTDSSVLLGQGMQPDARSLVLQIQDVPELGLEPAPDPSNPKALPGRQAGPSGVPPQDGDS